MKILMATHVAALTIGLGLVGTQALADPSDSHDRNDTQTEPQRGEGDNNRAVHAPTSTAPDRKDEHNRAGPDMSSWHRNLDAPRHYNAGAYRAPSGYAYRRYTYGERLPRAYYEENFWLSDFLSFGLLAPPSGFVWIRYGNDALLVDDETGEIVQVQYNVFA